MTIPYRKDREAEEMVKRNPNKVLGLIIRSACNSSFSMHRLVPIGVA